MADNLLQVEQLRKNFKTEQSTVRAVDGVDFTIDHGGLWS